MESLEGKNERPNTWRRMSASMNWRLWAIPVVVSLGLLFIGMPEANGYACTLTYPRAGKQSTTVTVATGMQGVIKTPASQDIWNTGDQMPSDADVYITNTAGSAFVQLGWYVGSANQLPVTTTPRLWWGENTPNGEVLTAGVSLSWNTYYKFTIQESATPGIFNLYLGSNYVGHNAYGHSIGVPSFNGESAYECTRMYALASHANSPYRNLQYLYNDTWSYFDAGNFTTDANHSSTEAGDIATNYSFGGG